MQIGDKMFAYIQNHEQLTQSMINEYKNSMIFLGDQKQIFVPIINSYVGLGTDAYNYILKKLGENNSNVGKLYENLTNNNVTSIYAQYSPEDVTNYLNQKGTLNIPGYASNIQIDDQSQQIQIDQLMAKRNVIIRGIHNDDVVLGNIDRKSGINVSIQHQGGNYINDFDEDGHPFTYWDPQHDIILIDDSKTWSYIASQSQYIINLSYQFATQQANRIYHDLLGTDIVYIEKEFNEVYVFDENGQISSIKDVYVKLDNNGNNYYAKTQINSGHIQVDTSDNSTPNWVNIYNISTNTIENASLLAEIGGSETVSDGTPTGTKQVPVWYQIDVEATSTYNTNLSDGIQTIKEVAYLLDIITNGDESGINLAYNISYNFIEIQKLKEWKNEIGLESVQTLESVSNNNLITVDTYSKDNFTVNNDNGEKTGNVKLELGLVLAQTYKDANNTTYAAYLAISEHKLDNYRNYYKKVDDTTDLNNYILVEHVKDSSTSIHKHLVEYYGSELKLQQQLFNVYTITNNTISDGNQGVSWQNLNNGDYIYWPYKRVFSDLVTTEELVTNGITTVDWVTTYVGWTSYNILKQIDNNNNQQTQGVTEAIHNLAYTDTDNSATGQFVTEVDQVDGIIKVNRKKLPLDKILSNHVYTSGNIYIPIGFTQAVELSQNNTIYYINGSGQYVSAGTPSDENIIYYIKGDNINNIEPITTAVPVSDLITNAGNLTYFYKVGSSDMVQYIPLDVQTAYTHNTPSDLFTVTNGVGTVLANKVYSFNPVSSANSSIFNKYFDTFTHQNVDGSTTTSMVAYVSYLSVSSPTRTGLADAWDVRRTIESMFTWVDIKTNKIIE